MDDHKIKNYARRYKSGREMERKNVVRERRN